VKYLAIARTQLLATLMYDRDLLVRSVFMVVIMVTFVQLWTVTFAATGETVISGFTVSDLVWYLVITEVVALSPPRIAQIVDTQVRTGDIAYALARPYSLPLYHVAWYWGDTLMRMPVNAAVGGAVAFLAVGPPSTSPSAIVATLLLWLGGITLKALIEMLIGLSAFWVEDTAPIEWIYAKILYTIGGLLLPLDLFPDWLATIARHLPFAAIMYAPARTFVGFSWPVFGESLATQLAWLVIFWLAIQLVFQRATRRLVTHGG
jgi:ABC-2 type transport system permease protein